MLLSNFSITKSLKRNAILLNTRLCDPRDVTNLIKFRRDAIASFDKRQLPTGWLKQTLCVTKT